jgi:hypothetical protein
MADEPRTTRGSGATAVRGSDTGGRSIWPWIIGAIILAAVVIGAIWVLTDEDDNGILDDNGTRTEQQEPAAERDEPATPAQQDPAVDDTAPGAQDGTGTDG